MKVRDADLGTLWEGLCYHFETQGLRVPPRRWRIFHSVVAEILIWGPTKSTPASLIRQLVATFRGGP